MVDIFQVISKWNLFFVLPTEKCVYFKAKNQPPPPKKKKKKKKKKKPQPNAGGTKFKSMQNIAEITICYCVVRAFFFLPRK